MTARTASRNIPDDIIHSAEKLLAEGGLMNASLNAIAAGSAVPRGSLLYHFPEGKNQIVQAALRAHDEVFSAHMNATLVAGDGFARSLSALMQGTARRMKVTGFGSGCPVAGVVLDLDPTEQELQALCAEIVAGWESTLASVLTQLSARRRQDTAEFILAAYEGAILLCRLKRNTQPLLNAARHIVMTLRSLKQCPNG